MSSAAVAPIVVVAAIFTDGDRVLACRRAPGRADAGLWEFPGRKVELGESPEAALSREIREELGVDVVVGALVDRSTTVVGIREIDLSCYLVTLTEVDASPVAAVATSTDHDELRWCREQLPSRSSGRCPICLRCVRSRCSPSVTRRRGREPDRSRRIGSAGRRRGRAPGSSG